MKRILLVTPYGGVPGGISRWASHIVDYYRNVGKDDCELVLVPMGRSMFVNINMSFVKRLWTAWIDYRKIFHDFFKKLNSEHCNVMHLASSGSMSLFKDLLMVWSAKRKGLKTVIHFRFGRIPELSQKRNWEWKMLTRVINACDKVIVIDKVSADTLIDNGYDNVCLLPNPLAPKIEQIIKENSDTSREKGLVLFTGHIVPTKGVFELVEACKSINGIRLKLVGHVTDEMCAKVEHSAGEGWQSWLEICGEKPYEEVIKDMMRCDLFVLPTYTEGFPNVILEAMATGCAIVTTPVGAIPQILEDDLDGRYGIMVSPGSVDELRDSIVSLLGDEASESEMRKNVVRRVHERYELSSVWRQMVDLWNNN